jgi:hypothetical protein
MIAKGVKKGRRESHLMFGSQWAEPDNVWESRIKL